MSTINTACDQTIDIRLYRNRHGKQLFYGAGEGDLHIAQYSLLGELSSGTHYVVYIFCVAYRHVHGNNISTVIHVVTA